MSFVNRFKNTFLFLVTVATLFCNEGFSQTKKVTLAEKTTISNPVEGVADLVATCPDDGTKMPKIFLCGALASRQISISFTNVASVNWEKLNESSCAAVTNTNCPNTNTLCSWSQVGTGSSFTVSDAGQYRIRVIFSDSSKNTFYFNVYQNGLDIPITKTDIYCGKAGEITIAQLTGYEYSLQKSSNYQTSNVFTITQEGNYTVYVRREGAGATDCVFEIPVTIAKNDLAVTPTVTQPIVSGDKGTIKLTTANARTQYYYQIAQGATLINQVGPVTESEHTFPNLNSGTYTWSVKTADCDWKSGQVTINSIAPFQITTIIKPITCQPGSVQVSVTGGTAPYKYYFNGNATAESSNSINVPVAGTYSIKVVDSNNQSDTFSVDVPNQPAPIYTIEKSNLNCYYPNTWQIKFNVTNKNGNDIKFSINNGATFSDNPVFQGLSATPAGTTFKTIIEYTYGGVKCTKTEDITLVQPQFGLSATAGVSELIGCIPSPDEDKAKIRITNPQGGTPPYQYSFDNQATWATTTSSLKTPGQYVFYIKDAAGCISALPSVTVENIGVPTIKVTNDSFNCDGTANSSVTITNVTATNFNYTYSLDGGAFQSSPNFSNISPGNHQLEVNYKPLIVPTFSNLLKEDFGYGADTTSPGMSAAYCFERQVVATQCKNSIVIQDGDYSVTSKIVLPYGAWYSPIDHTSPITPFGRYLAVNVNAVLDPKAILYEKKIADIIPNQPIIVEFYAANLLRKTYNATPPNLTIALVNSSGIEISTLNTGDVPRNELWNQYKKELDPGNNTSLRFIVRNNNPNGGGNDLAIDDISAYQIPKLCAATKIINFTVPTGKAFDANIIATKNTSCAGLSNGEITIAAQNFNATTGYQYSKDNGATWQTAMTSPFTISGLGGGNYNVKVRYSTGKCEKFISSITITVPTPLVTTANVTTLATCSRGATITATSTGGIPFYQFELWDKLNTTKIRPAQKSGIFDNVPPAKYTVRGLDANGCGNGTPVTITVLPPPTPDPFVDSTSDLCYDAIDQATIKINVTSGIAPFSYSLNGGALQNSNTFLNVGPGTYQVEVMDTNNCKPTTQNIEIGNELKVAAVLTKALDCTSTPDATIKVTIDGGASPIRYQILKGNTIISSADINLPAGDTSFTYTVSEANPATYSFNIIDANGCSKTTTPVTVKSKTLPIITSITQTQFISCHGDSTAAIKVNLDTSKGVGPFIYSVKEIASSVAIVYGNQLSGLPAGTYEVTVTDANSCTTKDTITISEPAVIDFDLDSVPINCGIGVSTFGSITVKDVVGGTKPFTYYVSNNFGNIITPYTATTNEDYTFSAVNFGIYTITVKDNNGCTKSKTVTIASPPSDLSIALTTTSNCINGGTAKVAVVTSVTSSSYEFSVLETNISPYSNTYIAADVGTPSTATFTGLIPGVKYSFVVHDLSTGCYFLKEASSPIPSISSLKTTIDSVNNITCKGSPDGKVTFTISNFDLGVASVNYQIFKAQNNSPVGVVQNQILSGSGSFTGELPNLVKGLYYIVFEEIGGPSNGCKVASTVFEIKESLLDLNLFATVLKNVNCHENGVISVQAKDGTAPYQYQISAVSTPNSNPIGTGFIPPPPPSPDGNWQTLNTFTVNQGGTYTVFVKDAYGCEKFQTVTVTKDPEPVIDLSVANLCVAEGNFIINITATTAGIAPYYLSVNGSVFNPSTLPAYMLNQNSGNYTIAIKDVNGCTNTQTQTIYSPLGLSARVIKQPTCTTNDGEIEALAVGGFGGSFEYKIDGGSYGTSSNFSGLSSGIHRIYSKDTTTGCEKYIDVNLEVPTAVTGLTLSQKSVTCNGGNDGSITATIATPSNVINNNPIYKYSLNGGTPQASNIFSGLVKGTYTIDVISGRGCVATATISVTEPAAIVIPALSVVEFGCNSTNNLNNASITVSGVTGGSGTYTQYEFIKNGIQVQFGPNPIYIEADLAGGSYTINVYDDKGCLGSTTTSIQPFYILNKINVDPIRPISCNAPEEIQLSTSAIGGTVRTMEYSLSPISGSLTGTTIPSNTTGSCTGLTVGEYLITARNIVTNCSLQLVHTVEEPNTFEISIDSVVDVSCYGASTGSASITLIDKTTPSRAATFSYHVLDSLGNLVLSDTAPTAGPITIPNLKAGVYSVTASLINAPFCSVTKKFTITQPTSALVLSESHSDITCVVGNNDGKITALPTGGWSEFYEFKWEKQGILLEDWGDVSELTNMTHGDYILYSRDAKGCVVYQSLTLAVPSPIVLTVSSDTTILSCFADRKATITTSNVAGGQGSDYWYTLNQITPNTLTLGPQISNDFRNLGAGTYTVLVNDNWSCTAKSGTIEIQEPANVISTLSLKTTPTCTVAAQLDLQIFGGTPPYSFSADNTVFNSFSAALLNGNTGVNHYFVKDNNGCGSYLSNDVVVESPKGLSVTIDTTFAKVNCHGESTASILATAQGGLGSYSYTLLDELDHALRPAQTAGIFSGLPAGKYKVKVTSADCVPAESTTITITEPTAKLKPSYSLTNALCAGSNDGTVKINSSGGTVVIKQSISPNLSQFTESNLFENLAAGTYDVLVQDALGCYEKTTQVITQPSPIIATTIASSIVQEICFDDKNAQFTILLSGGTLPYSVALDNPSGPFLPGSATQTQFDFTGLTGGSHTVYVQDSHNCTLDWIVNLDESVKLNPSTIVNYDCVNNSQHNLVTVNLDSSISDFSLVQFALDGGAYQPTNVFSNLTPGDHFIRVKHNNGCVKDSPVFNIKKVDSLILSLKEGGLNEIIAVANGGGGNYKYTFDGEFNDTNSSYIYYKTQDYLVTVQDANGCKTTVTQKFNYIDICTPNYFTPNGDGLNDTWAPGCTINYKNLTFSVLDRYGRELGNYHLGESWDGKYQGVELPSGDYWYVLKLNNSKDDREFVGHFTLYR